MAWRPYAGQGPAGRPEAALCGAGGAAARPEAGLGRALGRGLQRQGMLPCPTLLDTARGFAPGVSLRFARCAGRSPASS